MTDLQELNDDPAPIRNPHSGPMAEFTGVTSRGIRGFILDESVRSSRVLVTGGTGCIGTTVVRLLAAHGVEVVSVARRPPRERQRVQGPRYRQADIADAEAIGAILHEERPDLILHVAGQRLPALAETLVAETVRTNVIGTKVLVRAAADAGVGCIVTASTGKALRFYASEVYAATKKLSEYVVARAGSGEGLSCATVRFTHVVDNSVIGRRMLGWARNNEPIRLHAPGIAFYAQSALEAAQILVATAGAAWTRPTVAALSDIGWPHDLAALARDLVRQEGSESTIVFTGFEPGYEDDIFPGTYDPMGTTYSPLFNVFETARMASSELGPIQSMDMLATACPTLDERLSELELAATSDADDTRVRGLLHEASVALLDHTLQDATGDQIRRLTEASDHFNVQSPDHRLIHERLLAVSGTESAGLASY